MTEQLQISTESESEQIKPLSEAEEQVYRALLPRLKETSVRMDELGRTKEEVKTDKKSIGERKKQIESFGQSESGTSKKRSRILESILAEQIEMSNWFSQNVNTVISSEFDDLFNSIDMIVEFGDENEKDINYNPLGIDVTSTTERIELKLTKIRDHFKKYGGSRIKYFRTERENRKTKLNELPRLVIGVEPELIEELCQLWLEANKHRVEGKNPLELSDEERQKIREAREALTNHRTAVLILEEMQIQLEALEKFAIERKRNPEKFQRLLIIVENLLEEKEIDLADEEKNSQDKIYQAIKSSLEKIFP